MKKSTVKSFPVYKRFSFESVRISDLKEGDMFFTSKASKTYFEVSSNRKFTDGSFYSFRFNSYDKLLSYYRFRHNFGGGRMVFKIIE